MKVPSDTILRTGWSGTPATELYAYAPDNRRVYKKLPDGSEQYFFYGVNGDLLKTYSTTFQELKSYLYFAGRRVQVFGPGTEVQFVDRLGSVRTNSTNSRYYPYGEEQQATANDTYKFATYYRDATMSLDYAQNRYYASTLGRFTTPDPYTASISLSNPGSLNRYAYVSGDPINKNDPLGLIEKAPDPAPPDFWDWVYRTLVGPTSPWHLTIAEIDDETGKGRRERISRTPRRKSGRL